MLHGPSSHWTLIATALLLTAAQGFAQDSFLDELRIVDSPDFETGRTHRPRFLSSPQPDTESDSGRSGYTTESGPSKGMEPHEWDSQIHTVGAEEICASEGDATDCVPDDLCDIPLVRFRETCYQGSQASYGWLGDDPDTGLAIRTLDTSANFAVPLGSMDHLITFSPFFRADVLDGTAALDLPDSLYEAGVKSFWRRPINDRLATIVVFTPSVRSDFQTSDGAFRLFGTGLLMWKWIPKKVVLSGGAIYTGRADFPVLPAMGLLWTPTPYWRMDLQFPSPRLSYRIGKDGAHSETWLYLAGVFGGNTWAVTRASGLADELTIRDLRLVTGIEHLLTKNRGVFLETGWVFNRSVEYTTVPLMQDLDSTYMLRAGISF